MFHFCETHTLGIGKVKMIFLLKEKTSNISLYISFIKWEGNSKEGCFWVWRSLGTFEHE